MSLELFIYLFIFLIYMLYLFQQVFDDYFWLALCGLSMALTVILYVLLLYAKRDTTVSYGSCFATVFLTQVGHHL